MPARFLTSINRIPAAQWNALVPDDIPFLRHEFFAALESAACATNATGWKPSHLVLEDENGTIQGAVPLYLKSHSWGEFVFDWSWPALMSRPDLPTIPSSLA